MQQAIYQEITSFLNYGIYIYTLSIMLAYVFLAFNSVLIIRKYLRKNKTVYYDDILRSPLAPKISILAPAFNEGMSIVENIRSLLSLHYNNYEIIIINDGSKDDSIEQMITAYDLVPSQERICSDLPHQPIKNIYRSKDPAFKKLIVLDKENGGKSDALNAGINISSSPLIACVDVDCVIEDDALLKMVKPFLESVDEKMIATGGVVRIANDCIVAHGRILKVRLPHKMLPLFQTVEYIRAFLLGRMAWSRLNGLLIISGAFGLFDRELVVEAGGYDTKTVGEDMELVVRMRKIMHQRKQKYRVEYIPDPLCWTEAPESRKILIKQRNRWTRGTIETLRAHKDMFFNPKYGVLGMLSYPFWFFYEWLAPIIEFTGLIYFGILAYVGWVNWDHFWLLLILVYSFSVMYSWMAILMEETTFREYDRTRYLLRLLFVALLEPIVYHPITVWAAIQGNIDKFIRKKKTWGTQERVGFNKAKINGNK
ncbi:glycosyltransferase family 2 protein [Marinoscillum sp.]|uniref:glycosyltransferase family 2 protein n=1 Tax=Marinoscillum sp. TaxID=2024838 RepID=UPI003BA97BEB